MNDVEKEVFRIISEIGCLIAWEDGDKSLSAEFGIDSLQLVQIIIAIEDRFEFEFDDEDMSIGENLTAFKLCSIVIRHLTNK